MNDNRIIRMKLIKFALLQLNKEYKHNSWDGNSFDCASFVWFVFDSVLGINILKDGYGQSTTTQLLTSPIGVVNYDLDLSKIKYGDVLLFHTQSKRENKPTKKNHYPGHCGIYLGNEDIIHCTTMNDLNRVAITSLKSEDDLSKKLKRMLVASKNIVDYYK